MVVTVLNKGACKSNCIEPLDSPWNEDTRKPYDLFSYY